MPRDYAKKSRPKKGVKSAKRQPAPRKGKAKAGSLWLITGVLCGLFVAGLIYLHGRSDTQAAAQPTKATAKKTPQKVKKPARTVKAAKIPEPKFDFYTILPQQEVKLPMEGQPSQIQATTAQYILQIAAVLKSEDADRLKAQLTLLGFNVIVQKATKDKRTWYRVSVGPYRDKLLAEDDQSRLRKNKIDSLLIQLKQSA